MSERTLLGGGQVVPVEGAGWSVQVRRSDDGWVGLNAEWDDLVGRCAAATPFQSYAWLESWWYAYGEPGRLRLILVRYCGRLVAAAPMMLRRRAVCPVLTPLGGMITDFTDVLVDDELSVRASRVLADALVREPGWQTVDIPETRPGAVAGTALWEVWPGGRWWTPHSLCLELPAMPMDDVVRALPTHTRKVMRRRLNQLERADLHVRQVAAGDTGQAVADLLRLHARQWQGRGIDPHHLSPAFAAHLTRAAPGMIGSGQATLLEYRIGGELMASALVVIGRDLVGGYLYGMEPALRTRVDVTTMMMADKMPLAHRLGCTTVSMLRGAESYKMKWEPRWSQNRRILLTRPGSVQGLAYAIGVRAARGAVLAAKDYAPWLRTVRDQVRRSLGVVRANRLGRPR